MDEKLTINDDYVVVFKYKRDRIEKLTEQDKKHIRIMAILRIAKDGCISTIMNHAFTERFSFDNDKQICIYAIKLIKERKKHYADC